MREKTFSLKASDGKSVFCRTWHGEKPAKAVVQISHGMQEHSARYEGLARKLVDAGYVVYANDHRGHGRTVDDPSALGHLGSGGWRRVEADLKELSDLAALEHPGLPLILLGHSWGSFIAQAYAQDHGQGLRGLVLSGTNGRAPGLKAGVWLSKATVAIRGGNREASLLFTLSNGRFNKGFGPDRMGSEWLSRDPQVVQAFNADPLCGVPVPNSFYADMLELLATVWSPKRELCIPKSLPVYMFSGTEDPVGDRSRGVMALIQRYKALGLTDLEYRFYLGARHETLNETNRDEVHRDLIRWIDSRVG